MQSITDDFRGHRAGSSCRKNMHRSSGRSTRGILQCRSGGTRRGELGVRIAVGVGRGVAVVGVGGVETATAAADGAVARARRC